ncbi:hypothetical protein NLJ89_g1662 [Agrocybe chaxingu]|uniref:Uncharacterized protein n=1 Tax=Agrocybe chaxingu TaxID=84603 RepID=A0A9W8MZL5_9AGAR|nr:hypothetical protein NLJ89_g1662 [Agrocybe chaxingu]
MDDFRFALNSSSPSALRDTLVEMPRVEWSDIGGLEGPIQELREMVQWPIIHADKFKAVGLSPSRGVLLYGPPGTGKTLLAKAVASECGVNFIAIKVEAHSYVVFERYFRSQSPELLSRWFGESEANVRDLFAKARAVAPCLVFFDELDSLARVRSRGTSSDSGTSDRVLKQLLAKMDGIHAKENVLVLVLAATNRPDEIDPAFLRPGRLDRLLSIPLPDRPARLSILKAHLRKSYISPDISEYLESLAQKTDGFSGADLMDVSRRAAHLALRDSTRSETLRSDTNILEIDERETTTCFVARKHLDEALRDTRPSVTEQTTRIYEMFAKNFHLRLTVADASKIQDKPVQFAAMHVSSMESLSLRRSGPILVEGERGSRTILACTDVECSSDQIGMHEVARANLQVELGDQVTVFSPGADEEAVSISVLPLEDCHENGSSDVEGAVKKYFKEAGEKYLPFHEGNIFITENGIRFKVLSIKPSPFSTVTERTRVEFGDGYWTVGGCRPQIEKIRSWVENPLCCPRSSNTSSGPPCGVLLFGQPGTGRHSFARAVANELQASFYPISTLDLRYNDAIIRRAEEEAEKRNAPVIIFIDDIDAIGSNHENQKEGRGVESGVLMRLLDLMDRLKAHSNVIFFAATDRPQHLDSRLTYSGRFERELDFNIPDVEGRLEILRIHTRRMRLDDDVNLKIIAEETEGFVAANVAALCHKAASNRGADEGVQMKDFQAVLPLCCPTSPRVTTSMNSDDRARKSGHIGFNAESIQSSNVILTINNYTNGPMDDRDNAGGRHDATVAQAMRDGIDSYAPPSSTLNGACAAPRKEEVLASDKRQFTLAEAQQPADHSLDRHKKARTREKGQRKKGQNTSNLGQAEERKESATTVLGEKSEDVIDRYNQSEPSGTSANDSEISAANPSTASPGTRGSVTFPSPALVDNPRSVVASDNPPEVETTPPFTEYTTTSNIDLQGTSKRTLMLTRIPMFGRALLAVNIVRNSQDPAVRMLNPPFSRLSPQLRDNIVDHCANLTAWWIHIANLALADRAFTARCRTHTFKEFTIRDACQSDEDFEKIVKTKWRVLDNDPSLARLVQGINISVCTNERTALLSSDTLMEVFKILGETPIERKVRFEWAAGRENLADPEGLVKSLSSLSSSLTILHLRGWSNIPLEVFRVCSNLKNLILEEVIPADDPGSSQHDSAAELPKLERLEYREGHEIIKLFSSPESDRLVDLSNLRILKASPHEPEDMKCLQPILDMTSETLEELYLTNFSVGGRIQDGKLIPLQKLVNLKSVKKLCKIGMLPLIDCKTKKVTILSDLCAVLNTMPDSNAIHTVIFEVGIIGKQPFKACLDQDWDGLCQQLVRISAGKALKFSLFTSVYADGFDAVKPGSARLYEKIDEKIRNALADHPRISFLPLNSISQWEPL